MRRDAIILKTPEEIESMRAANLIVAEILAILADEIGVGTVTMDLEKRAEEETAKRGARPAFKGYNGYPWCLCTSLNSEVVHGMPSREKILKEGDILSIDFGVFYNGFYGDAAVTIPVGRVSEVASRLVETTKVSLEKAIDAARPGGRLGDISSAVQRHAEGEGFSIVREFVGHGIGRSLHEPPQVPNFGTPGKGVKLKAGMVLAIEPMINAGGPETRVLDDGWTAVTADGSLSAHFEHTVAITKTGPLVLTRL